MFQKIQALGKDLGRKIGAAITAPSSSQIQMMLFLLGLTLLAVGLNHGANAALGNNAVYNDDRIAEAVDIIMLHIQGSFGALVMVACGIGAILSAAFGNYKASLGLLVVAVGAFILRSLISTFFNDESLEVNTVR